jgi:signal transduction histidine kinase
MQLANQIFFLVFALLSFTFFFSYFWQFNFSDKNNTNNNLLISCGLYGICCLGFGLAPWVNQFFLTIANTCYVAANIALICLYSSWSNQPFSRWAKITLWSLPVVIGILYEPLRSLAGTFQQRVALITISQELLLLWQLVILFKFRYISKNPAVKLILFLTMLNLLASSFRTFRILSLDNPNNTFLYTEDPLALGIRWFGFTCVLLVYIAISLYYMQDQIKIEQALRNTLNTTYVENLEITRLLKEKEQLISSLIKVNKTVETGALSASIAHEINQPLGASGLNIEYLRKKLAENKLNPEEGQEVLGQLAIDNQRASNIIKSLRALFINEKTDTQQHDLNGLIQSMLAIVKGELNKKQIKITLDLEPQVKVEINSNEMQQVFLNLLINSINAFSAEGGEAREIKIESRSTAQEVRIVFSDNGPGIPLEAQPNLFELLSESKKASMGLGLWLCKYIVTRHNGNIWFEKMPTKGAKFIIKLPQRA